MFASGMPPPVDTGVAPQRVDRQLHSQSHKLQRHSWADTHNPLGLAAKNLDLQNR